MKFLKIMIIVITGAGKGIGRETALELLCHRQNTVVALSRQLEKLTEEALNLPGKLITVQCDLSVNDDVCKIIEVLEENGIGLVDRLVCNAGVVVNKSFKEIKIEDIRSLFDVNFFSHINLIQILLPLMCNPSHIVTIGSMAAFQGAIKYNGLSAYCSAKAALACLTECLALEFKHCGISVNCLALGEVQSEVFVKAFPEKEVNVKASEMAQYITDFVINANKFINGKIIPVSLS